MIHDNTIYINHFTFTALTYRIFCQVFGSREREKSILDPDVDLLTQHVVLTKRVQQL